MQRWFPAAQAAFFILQCARRPLLGLLAGCLLTASTGFARACEILGHGSDPAATWVLPVVGDETQLPASCAPMFARIAELLAAQPAARVWIASVIDAAEASSLNIAVLAGMASSTEQALREHGITRTRIRLNEFRIPHREGSEDPSGELIGRILIQVDAERPVFPD